MLGSTALASLGCTDGSVESLLVRREPGGSSSKGSKRGKRPVERFPDAGSSGEETMTPPSSPVDGSSMFVEAYNSDELKEISRIRAEKIKEEAMADEKRSRWNQLPKEQRRIARRQRKDAEAKKARLQARLPDAEYMQHFNELLRQARSGGHPNAEAIAGTLEELVLVAEMTWEDNDAFTVTTDDVERFIRLYEQNEHPKPRQQIASWKAYEIHNQYRHALMDLDMLKRDKERETNQYGVVSAELMEKYNEWAEKAVQAFNLLRYHFHELYRQAEISASQE